MIRSTAVPRSLRVSAALVGVAGALTLAGCATDTTTAPAVSTDTDAAAGDTGTGTGGGGYTDGTYTADGSYATPESVEAISVTVTLEGDVITAVEVTGDPTKRESEQYQEQFIGGISDEVVGQDIDDISVSRVAGSSLTSGGFNQAIEAIKSEAAA